MAGLIADRMAVQDVMLRYAAGVDDRDMELYRSCFAAEVEVAGFGPQTYRGRDNWIDYVRDALQQYGPTQHMLGPTLATIDGDQAQCRTDVQALHYLREPEGASFTLWATYLTNMRRISGTWQIVRHELVSRGSRTDAPPLPIG